jgi:hypothetical protein
MAIIQNDPVINLPFLYKYGLMLSNDATTPNTVIDIGAGQCRDSNDVMDIAVGVANANVQGNTIASPLLVSSALKGAGGLDAGTIAASTMYAVYVIADSRYYQPTAGLLSLASNATPTIPFGYDSYRLIGYWATNASSNFLPGYWSGSSNAMVFTYDAPQATSVTAGASATYASVVLTTLVPPVQYLPVSVAYAFTPAAASNTFNMNNFGGTGNETTITGQVAAVINSGNIQVIAALNVAAPTIQYKVSAGTVAINVAGYSLYL